MGEFKYECGWCPQRRNCEWAFGKYWNQRSNSAKGCNIGFGEMGKAERRVERSSTVKAEAKPATPPKPVETPKPTRPARPGEARQGSLF